MLTRDIAYEAGGRVVTGYLAVDEAQSGKRPGILVFHQGGGLRDHEKDRARRLAQLGYVAFAPDMYGEVSDNREKSMAMMNELIQNPELLHARAFAGLAQLKVRAETDPAKLAAIGFCFGGGVVIELARSAPELACVVAFHPGMAQLPEVEPRPVHAKIMVCAGEKDPLIPTSAREKFIGLMKAASADWQLLTYGNAGHSFTDKSIDAYGFPGFNYDAAADRRSWAAMREMFEESFGAA